MSLRRRQLNIYLIILALTLGGLAVWISGRPSLVLEPEPSDLMAEQSETDTVAAPTPIVEPIPTAVDSSKTDATADADVRSLKTETAVRNTRFKDIDTRTISADHPFRAEAMKVLNGHLEETDSANRHQILSYCEHLRTSYTTRDIDFIRQVFSDNALIIVGHVVKTGNTPGSDMSYSNKVNYSIRSKQDYIKRLARIFDSNKEIDVRFSDFKVMRHPTVAGIYGVTLRQKYSCDSYSDDGFLFLLWDFRDKSMPLIHVRTWQPSLSLENGDDEIIDMSDFNFE